MKKTVKIMAFVLCAVMLVVGSVFGTYAYLTSQTQVIKNTFTVGNVAITLDETKTDEYGKAGDPVVRWSDVEGNTYKLIPGHTYTKDPKITVSADSEDCWVFIKVENGLADIEMTGDSSKPTIVEQMTAAGWVAVETNVYAYTVEALSEGDEVTAFTSFTIKGDKGYADVSAYGNATIKVTGYAVQADGFAIAQAAWTAAKGNFGF